MSNDSKQVIYKDHHYVVLQQFWVDREPWLMLVRLDSADRIPIVAPREDVKG